MPLSAAERLTELRSEIATDLGNGSVPENRLREFRFLWLTTPNQEKDGLGFTLREIEDFVSSVRREVSITNGANKIRRHDIEWKNPTELTSTA